MRPFALVCSSLLLFVAACSSTPSPQRVQQPSIFDVLEQSKQSYADPDRPRSPSSSCPGGAVNMCVAEAGSMHPDKCSCVDRTEAWSMLGGRRF
jgi:hypothetical protein